MVGWVGNSADRRRKRRLAERVATILGPFQTKKPIDAWLQLGGTAVGIVLWLWPNKTLAGVVIALERPVPPTDMPAERTSLSTPFRTDATALDSPTIRRDNSPIRASSDSARRSLRSSIPHVHLAASAIPTKTAPLCSAGVRKRFRRNPR